MTRQYLLERVAVLLGREVEQAFVDAVLYGDPFVYEARRREDPEATRVVLGLATGRIT